MLKYLTIASFILLSSCEDEHATYLHIAHTRSYEGARDKLMEEVEGISFEKYDVLMLGGDLVYESTGKRETLDHLDKIFDLSKDHVLWTLGNHDYHHHPEWIPETTKRPNTYAFHKNNISYLVLDSQEDYCNTNEVQKDLLESTIVSLSLETTHLIILHHKLIWMMDEGVLQEKVDEVSNGESGTCFHCVMPNDFHSKIYPKLVEVQEKGVQVICIAGDIGAKKNEFEFQTKEGIYFLASGLKDKSESNKVLLFDHDINKGTLDWRFEFLNNLPTKKLQ